MNRPLKGGVFERLNTLHRRSNIQCTISLQQDEQTHRHRVVQIQTHRAADESAERL